MNQPTPNDLLNLALKAGSAGAKILAKRPPLNSSVGLVASDDKSAAGDWVTEFDRTAERAVRESIAATRPDDALTGEEYPASGGADGYRWSIDPLDGTVNFVRGIAYHATSVAVCGPHPTGAVPSYADAGENANGMTPQGETWLAGVVIAPALHVVYLATRGGGAWKAPWPLTGTADVGQADAPIPGAVRLSGPDVSNPAKVLSTGFSYDAAKRQVQWRALGELLPDFVNVRRIGSAALDLCLVAEGAVDAYAEMDGNEWDWAAGALIAREAGVPVITPSDRGWVGAGDVDVANLPLP